MKLWRLTVPAAVIPFLSRMFEPDAAGRSRLELSNRREVNTYLDRIGDEMKEHEAWQIEALGFKNGPEETLRIEEPSFSLDFFFIRNNYASAQLRAAFTLGPDQIAYRPIDASQCSDAARAMDYNAFLPLKVANPFDPARMPGRVRPVRQEDGSLRDEWVVELPMPHPNTPPTPIQFLPGFLPPAPMFRPLGMPVWIYATEDLAERVSRAGVTGIAFQEPEGDRAANETIYRSPG